MCESYREQIQRLSRALACGDCTSILDDVQESCSANQIKMFVDGNFEKRFEKLADQLEFVAEPFDDFERLIEAYCRYQPLSPYETGARDGQRMLAWLVERRALTPTQRDYVRCQQARHTVEELARTNRSRHMQFQQLWAADRKRAEFDPATAVLHCNPVRANTTLITRTLLDGAAEPPTEALFFPVGYEIATAVLDPEVLRALEELSQLGPTSVDQWSAAVGCSDLSKLCDLAQQLQAIGLLAAA